MEGQESGSGAAGAEHSPSLLDKEAEQMSGTMSVLSVWFEMGILPGDSDVENDGT